MARPAIPHLVIKLNLLLRRSNNAALAVRRPCQDRREDVRHKMTAYLLLPL
jgi:hypothetical protein